jgi:hypothetical protein
VIGSDERAQAENAKRWETNPLPRAAASVSLAKDLSPCFFSKENTRLCVKYI